MVNTEASDLRQSRVQLLEGLGDPDPNQENRQCPSVRLFGPLDRFFLYLEEKGWIFYRNKKPSSSPASMWIGLHQALEPGVKHLHELSQDAERRVKRPARRDSSAICWPVSRRKEPILRKSGAISPQQRWLDGTGRGFTRRPCGCRSPFDRTRPIPFRLFQTLLPWSKVTS